MLGEDTSEMLVDYLGLPFVSTSPLDLITIPRCVCFMNPHALKFIKVMFITGRSCQREESRDLYLGNIVAGWSGDF